MDKEKLRGQAAVEYVEKFSGDIKPKEMVELYEYYLLLSAYRFLKSENDELKEKLAKKETA